VNDVPYDKATYSFPSPSRRHRRVGNGELVAKRTRRLDDVALARPRPDGELPVDGGHRRTTR
jgi:hypothetical protein